MYKVFIHLIQLGITVILLDYLTRVLYRPCSSVPIDSLSFSFFGLLYAHGKPIFQQQFVVFSGESKFTFSDLLGAFKRYCFGLGLYIIKVKPVLFPNKRKVFQRFSNLLPINGIMEIETDAFGIFPFVQLYCSSFVIVLLFRHGGECFTGANIRKRFQLRFT